MTDICSRTLLYRQTMEHHKTGKLINETDDTLLSAGGKKRKHRKNEL